MTVDPTVLINKTESMFVEKKKERKQFDKILNFAVFFVVVKLCCHVCHDSWETSPTPYPDFSLLVNMVGKSWVEQGSSRGAEQESPGSIVCCTHLDSIRQWQY